MDVTFKLHSEGVFLMTRVSNYALYCHLFETLTVSHNLVALEMLEHL